MTSRNQQLFEQSQQYIPGGVNSPVRAFKSVGGSPIFFQRGDDSPSARCSRDRGDHPRTGRPVPAPAVRATHRR